MSTMEQDLCHDDSNCPQDKYCYNVSNQCVDYTQCVRYNRQENQKRSRNASQCGPCLPGYESEILSTGKMAWSCKKKPVREDTTEIQRFDTDTILYVVVAIVLMCLTVAVGIFLKRRSSKRQKSSVAEQWDDNLCVVGPSAPPMESSPFIGRDQGLSNVPFNNNQNLKDKNKLVSAVPCKEPIWVRLNPNYENNVNNDNMNALDQSHSVAEVPSTDDDSNTWTIEQLTLQVANGNAADGELEQIDNSTNAVLVQRNDPSPTNATADDNENNNTNNNNDSTSEPSNSQSSRERVRNSNILINQKISMNVNLFHNDT